MDWPFIQLIDKGNVENKCQKNHINFIPNLLFVCRYILHKLEIYAQKSASLPLRLKSRQITRLTC